MRMATIKPLMCLFLSLVVLICLSTQPALTQILLQVSRDCIDFSHEFPFAKQAGASIQLAPCVCKSGFQLGVMEHVRARMVRPPAEPGRRHRRRRDHPCLAAAAVALRRRARSISDSQSQIHYISVTYVRNIENYHRGVKKTACRVCECCRIPSALPGGCTT